MVTVVGYPEDFRPIVDGEKVAMYRLTVITTSGQRRPMMVNIGVVANMARTVDGITILSPPERSFCIHVIERPETINDRFMDFFAIEPEGRC